MITLTEEEASFLGFTQRRVKEKPFLIAIRKAVTLYSDDRFAPEDVEENYNRVLEICRKFEIEPTVFTRAHHFYCGNGYLPDTASVGSLAYCHTRGSRKNLNI